MEGESQHIRPINLQKHVTHMDRSCHTYEWVLSHKSVGHVIQTNESCHKYKGFMSQIWMYHDNCVNASWHTHDCVMSHLWMRHVSHVNKACRISENEWESQYIRPNNLPKYVTCMNQLFHTYGWVLSHMWMWCVHRHDKHGSNSKIERWSPIGYLHALAYLCVCMNCTFDMFLSTCECIENVHARRVWCTWKCKEVQYHWFSDSGSAVVVIVQVLLMVVVGVQRNMRWEMLTAIVKFQ